MGFAIGDIIVLLVVVVILAVYRQMDRNNRSIERVKRFVERVQGEMDEIVAEKVTMLKDIGIEVDVHQKTAKEVLKRITSIEDDLNSRTDSLEAIGSRLTDYEQVLDQLVVMTQRTEENIGRVKDESEYVDKVGKRIKATQGKIEELERSLPGIVSGFEKQNDERLAELEQRFFASSEQRVSELDGRVDGARSRVQEFQEEVVRLTTEVEESSLATRNDLQQLHSQLADQTREEIESIASQGRRDFEQRKGEISEILDEAARRGESFREDSERDLEHLTSALQEAAGDAEARLDTLAEEGRSLATDALTQLRAYISDEQEKSREELSQSIARFDEEQRQRMAAVSAAAETTRDTLINDSDENARTLRADVIERYAALRNEFESMSSRTDSAVDDLSNRVDHLTSSIQQRVAEAQAALDAHSGEVDARIESERNRLDENFRVFREEYERDRTTIEESAETLGTSIADLERRISDARVTSEEKIVAMEQNLGERIGRSSQEVETRVLGELEQRLAEYENDLNYRFTKIETVNTDIDQLEDQLRATMDRISERVRGDFLSFGEEIRDLREQDRVEAEQTMERLRGSMGELEGGLNELKQRAYENVSEKLKVFEDEFFADLRERSDAMEAKIVQWRDDVDARLTTLQTENTEGRNAVEQQYNEDLRSRLHQFQETMNGILQKGNEQITSFREGLQSRMDSAEEHINGFEATMHEELSALKERSFQTFRQEFSQADTRVRDELKEFEHEIDGHISAIRGTVKDGTEELEGMIVTSRSDITVWQTEVSNQLRSSGADVNNQLADTKVRLSENLQELKREYTEERDELVGASQDERTRLKNEITSLGGTVQKLEDRVSHVSTEAIEEFEERYKALKHSLDVHEESVTERIETGAGDFRVLIEDTRGQFQAMRDKLLGKLEEEARTLETTLGEIDKRQQAFIEQTKIFERADTLKEGLTGDIGELKTEIERVEGLRGEVRDIEGQFAKIKKMSVDTNEKIARFSADKRRIDLLEEDYKRLIALAQSVEQKIEHVGSSDQQLQEIIARLRSLDDLQQEVEARFDRMEKRRASVDETADGIEVNSRTLADIEKKMTDLTRRVEEMPKHVATLSGQLKKVAAARKDTDLAVNQLAKLDETLADVESRMQELQTAREWLARTETRLEEIRRDAGEQVKLLGSIMREETRKNPVDGGAPSLSARETVQKLAHQGWNVDEIARATKVSKGEVELILELTTKK